MQKTSQKGRIVHVSSFYHYDTVFFDLDCLDPDKIKECVDHGLANGATDARRFLYANSKLMQAMFSRELTMR